MLNRLFTLSVVRAASRRQTSTASAAEAAEVPGLSGSGGPMLPRLLRAVRTWTWCNVLLPTTFGYRYLQPLGPETLLTRVQSQLVALFIVLKALATAVGHSVYHADILFVLHLPPLSSQHSIIWPLPTKKKPFAPFTS
jgi:hypothetical protein